MAETGTPSTHRSKVNTKKMAFLQLEINPIESGSAFATSPPAVVLDDTFTRISKRQSFRNGKLFLTV